MQCILAPSPQDVGYNHGKTLFGAWGKTNVIDQLFEEKSSEKMKPILHKASIAACLGFAWEPFKITILSSITFDLE